MTSLITPAGMADEIRKMAKTAKMKADMADEAFLKRADPRAVQGGAIDEVASQWRELSGLLFAASRFAARVED
jgi:hypothetical protein